MPPAPICEDIVEENNNALTTTTPTPRHSSNVTITPEDTVVTISQENQHIAEVAKDELETNLAQTANDFSNEDEFFASITGEPPPNCQYSLRINQTNVNKICQAMDDLANDRPVRESAKCHVSNCSTASYLAMIQIAKTRSDWSSIQSRFTCNRPFPEAYRLFVGPNGLQAFMQQYELGDARRIRLNGSAASRSTKLQSDFAQGFPRKSDPILLQRDQTKGGTGHSVIFSHFETSSGSTYNPESPEQISKICYWSSNQGTHGSSNRCENVSYMSFIDAAHLKS
ncbi:MAG: hypothetical protein COW01_09735 [Bdellovibrionales bacterium CG12_big_fil_rev_8_21_14_0_65_38_15]|nr:MAG: hypothetical protein COW79_07920 [Bdellovibrionales bacterium CG22_combo_CG10-13_8_21_14_all_38_13]PIQ54666.1 MAG: hypothetical protein COW01_09735 [Bdellovibrionales bacterium CG12_big_fil_rev_8_21_14_0_65_38_15]PIR29123.1 MAG: hypothetical protein COV38_12865 [Bdellovibrionales bacterium CG11_big_fil_rev_8_21_14_0_20_38_13]